MYALPVAGGWVDRLLGHRRALIAFLPHLLEFFGDSGRVLT